MVQQTVHQALKLVALLIIPKSLSEV
uniref:Uncharacterized protein n=1 Tax=Vitis vinifera TaxID=29760 RepID=F6GUM8_VITVI